MKPSLNMFLFFICFVSFLSSSSLAYIPPLQMILSRVAENSGRGLYNIELEVTFNDGTQEAAVKELWTIENERTLKVSAYGLKELKGLSLNYLYVGNQRWAKKAQSKEQTKISEDFIEKWQHFRSSELFQSALIHQSFLPEDAFNRKDSKPKSVNEDAFVKLSRTQGIVAYSIGDNKKYDILSPRFWIEQDFFMVRKIRFPSGAEIYMDNYKSFAKNLHYPKDRTLKWANNSVSIKTLSVSAKVGNPNQIFSQQGLESNNQSDILYNHPLKNQIEEFYTRFR